MRRALQSYESRTSHGFFVMYYGPEFVAKKVQDWIEERDIGAVFIEPGSPWQNGHNESFNGVFRDGCLDRWWFPLGRARKGSCLMVRRDP